jgi:hypothetical protein
MMLPHDALARRVQHATCHALRRARQRRTKASARLQAVRKIAAACCGHGGCSEVWQSLADEAAQAAPNATSTKSSLCETLTMFCDQQGHIIEIDFNDSAKMQCKVDALEPLAALRHLDSLGVHNSGITGARPHQSQPR